jgi:hypothetical protein
MPKLTDKLRKIHKQLDEPLWRGPCSDDPNGGITQSMINRFLVCRERFRVHYVLGLRTPDDFIHRIEYGNMWHACEESLASGDANPFHLLEKHVVELCQQYPLKKEAILHWYNICMIQFPIYREWWSKHEDVVGRTPLLQEEVFNIPYTLPSGRVVRMRGKFDSVDLIDVGVWLQENKTKGEVDPVSLQRQLMFDLQTGFYLVALDTFWEATFQGPIPPFHDSKKIPVQGVRYNVVRRPLSGGKGSIRQKKGQSLEEFYEELGGVIRSAVGPEWGVLSDEHYFFMRWKVGFTSEDIEKYKTQFLNPILEQLCDWNEEQESLRLGGLGPFDGRLHFRMPYGIYSPLYDGKPTDQDEYLDSGSTVGLHRTDSLFKELK